MIERARMGAWGSKAWENDRAADWFSSFFDGIDVDSRIADALEDEEDHERIRATGHLLAVLGRAYVWPGDLERLDEHPKRAIALLTQMLAPEGDQGGELSTPTLRCESVTS